MAEVRNYRGYNYVPYGNTGSYILQGAGPRGSRPNERGVPTFVNLPPIEQPKPAAPVAPPPPPPTPTYSAPAPSYAAPSAPSVATASVSNEVRESEKRRKGYQSTVLSMGSPKRARARTSGLESKLLSQKKTVGETTRKTLGSA